MENEREVAAGDANGATGVDHRGVPTRVVAPTERQLLSPEALASYLGVPLATVYRWRSLP